MATQVQRTMRKGISSCKTPRLLRLFFFFFLSQVIIPFLLENPYFQNMAWINHDK